MDQCSYPLSDNALQIQVLKKEMLFLHTDSTVTRDSLIREFKDCIEAANLRMSHRFLEDYHIHLYANSVATQRAASTTPRASDNDTVPFSFRQTLFKS